MKLLFFTTLKTKLLSFLLAIFITGPVASSQFQFAYWHCLDVGNYTINGAYQYNVINLLHNLTNQAFLSGFGSSSVGEGQEKVYTIYNCRGDLDSQQCHDCVKEAAQEILERCPSEKESIVWFEECMVRYANRSLISLKEESPYSWGYLATVNDDPSPQLYSIVAEKIEGLIEQAAYNRATRGFALDIANIALLDNLYILVQCTADILGMPCERCLRAAFKSMAEYAEMGKSIPLMMLYPSCHIRYDREPILLNGADYSPSYPPLPVAASPSIYIMPPTTGSMLLK
ncbi:cysteine-rich receptor-like protein kinase 25 [Chenopodium quinoa]|uniref:cysteine-rich receptor-like protein kinase 25 n=1 Tax=Chenopodium quinoa TaxID=63459 RepID=UPI000B782FDC|nr:cysteine-rich receptor-like protein kinase 25 [Chenopodium quinoa]